MYTFRITLNDDSTVEHEAVSMEVIDSILSLYDDSKHLVVVYDKQIWLRAERLGRVEGN